MFFSSFFFFFYPPPLPSRPDVVFALALPPSPPPRIFLIQSHCPPRTQRHAIYDVVALLISMAATAAVSKRFEKVFPFQPDVGFFRHNFNSQLLFGFSPSFYRQINFRIFACVRDRRRRRRHLWRYSAKRLSHFASDQSVSQRVAPSKVSAQTFRTRNIDYSSAANLPLFEMKRP